MHITASVILDYVPIIIHNILSMEFHAVGRE